MERHGYDDGWDSNYKEQETVGFSGRFAEGTAAHSPERGCPARTVGMVW